MEEHSSPAIISPLVSPLLRTDSEIATGNQRIASLGLAVFVMQQALRLDPWFLFTSPDEKRKEKTLRGHFLPA